MSSAPIVAILLQVNRSHVGGKLSLVIENSVLTPMQLNNSNSRSLLWILAQANILITDTKSESNTVISKQ